MRGALPASVADELNLLASTAVSTGTAVTREVGGIAWEIRPTGWLDANGVHGYLAMPGPASVQTVRLGARELASKRENE